MGPPVASNTDSYVVNLEGGGNTGHSCALLQDPNAIFPLDHFQQKYAAFFLSIISMHMYDNRYVSVTPWLLSQLMVQVPKLVEYVI